jgi:flagellar motor switch protein FliN/FliY
MTPYGWLKQIPSSLLQWDDIPLLGNPPAFPWEEFSSLISQNIGLQGFKISPSDVRWLSKEEYFKGISHPDVLSLSIAGVEGHVHWMMSEQDINYLMSMVITKKADFLHKPDPEFTEGFYYFLALEAINTIGQVNFDSSLSIQIDTEQALPLEAALCLDINIEVGERKSLARLLISPEFRKAWAGRYKEKEQKQIFQQPLSQKLELTLHLQVAKTHIGLSEWKKINLGDFIVLEKCSLDPTAEKGRLMLTFRDTSLFRAQIKNGTIKILEFPLHHEELTTMTNIDETSEFDEFEDEDFDEFDDSEFESDEFEEDETAELSSDQLTTESTIESPAKKLKKASKEHSAEYTTEHTSEHNTLIKEKPISPLEIPLSIAVEVGRIKVSIEKFMEMQPGNLIELDNHDQSSVELVFNGKCIAKGELLKIGETLGVRITEKG